MIDGFLEEIGEKHIYIISRSGNDIRALKGKPAEFGFKSTMGNVSTTRNPPIS